MSHRPKLLLLLLPLAGCASPGQPKPPSLHLPQPATSLTASRLGPDVLLTWTTSPNSTDNDTLRTPITAVLCRDLLRPNQPVPQQCTPIAHLPVTPGLSHATDPLPLTLQQDPPQLLSYRIVLGNARGRSAGPSAPVFAPSGAAPPATGPLTATPSRSAITLTWHPQPSPGALTELERTQAPNPAKPARKTASNSQKQAAGPVLLRPTLTSAPDPGGLTDTAVTPLQTYTYIAQRVRPITLSGHPLELRGLPSPPATLFFQDIFPPTAPTGLTSVLSGGFSGPPSIDLSWEPNPESDLLGYNLYRADAGQPFQRLNSTPIPGPAYRDLTAQPGHLYRYRVTALDQTQNESQPSPAIQEQLRK